MHALAINSLKKRYANGVEALKGIDLEVGQGDFFALLGPNGAGKTTFFHIIMGLIKPYEGEIEVFGQKIKKKKDFEMIRRKIGLLFQDADDQLFNPTVLEDVAFGPLNMGCSGQEAKVKALATLSSLGLADFENRVTHQLSGGEKKLVALATILVMEPDILLLDEPTNNLDPGTRERLVSILDNLNLPMVIISHDFDFLSKITDVIYSLEHGHLHKSESIHLHSHPHAHVYGDHPHDHGG